MHSSPRAGFTLTEMIMVIMLVSLLAAVAIPNFIDMRTDAKIAVTQDAMAALKRAITGDSRVTAGSEYTFPGFAADVGRLPTALTELTTQGALSTYNPLTRSGWRGPYVDTSSFGSGFNDAWGTAFEYSSASRYIRSWGPNTINNAGGGDDITLNF